MQPLAFIPKENSLLPDAYGLTVYYIDGKTESFEIASHKLGEAVFEFVTHADDIWHWIVMSNVKRVQFDKRFSTIIAIKAASAS